MKKKCIAALALAAALVSQPAWAFAAGSASSSGSDGSGSINSSSSSSNKDTTSSKFNATVSVSSTGVKTTGAITSVNPTGSTIGVIVDMVTTTGQQVTTNSKGEAVIGDTAAAFADSAAATAGPPSGVAPAINNTNARKPLNEVVQGVDLTGCNALTGMHAIITKDTAADAVKTDAVKVPLYVSNLTLNVDNVQVLFYDNATSQ